MLFKDLTNTQLSLLRARIILDSNLPVRLYKNPYNVDPSICKDFFEGYYNYLLSLADTIDGCDSRNRYAVAEAQDNYSNLVAYRTIYEQKQYLKAKEFLR